MKIVSIAAKDLVQAFRNGFVLVMMFVAPLLIVGLIYLAFGGLTGGDGDGFELPITRVQVVNLDTPDERWADFSVGNLLTQVLADESLSNLLEVVAANNEAAARAAVIARQADVALIIPPGFTAAALSGQQQATITLLHDPAATIGPSIVRSIVAQFVDAFNGQRIAADVAAAQLAAAGLPVDDALRQTVAAQYSDWVLALSERLSAGTGVGITLQAPPDVVEASNPWQQIIAGIFAGQIIFFSFYTAANSATSILREDEEKTLSRLFTTATPRAAILAGKFLFVLVILIIQILVLLALAALLFDIRWGRPASVAVMILALVIGATGFGVMLISFLKNTRQSGPVLGGVLPALGMAGGLFTAGLPNVQEIFRTISLFTPHGWALRGWQVAISGGNIGQVLPSAAVLAATGLVFFFIGLQFFRRRFA